MRKYPNISDLQSKIISDGTVRLVFSAAELKDIIHPYSVSGYEYLSGGFVEFLDRFRSVLPGKMPIVLQITGKQYDKNEKAIIDRAVRMHYGLSLSEAAANLRKTRIRMLIYFLFMILSSSLLFLVSNSSEEVVTNLGYVLFWFFGYRLLIHLILDYQPIYKEYRWYRRLSSLKLVFSEDEKASLNSEQISRETSHYAHEADIQTRNHSLIEQVLMEETYVSLGCCIEHVEEVVLPSGAGDMEIVSYEMADYLMSALPFIKQRKITKLTIEGSDFTEKEQSRINAAIRNYLAFTIAAQDTERKTNKGVSIVFVIGLFLSAMILYIWGKYVNLAVHEFILVAFWFFADYLLEFIILSNMRIRSRKKDLEKLANMDITYTCS